MIPVEVALRDHLLADTTIAALIGKRIHPLALPLNSPTPALTYENVSDVQHRQVPGWSKQRIQFTVCVQGQTSVLEAYPNAKALKEAIKARVDGRAGTKYPCVLSGGEDEDEDKYSYKIISIEFEGGPELPDEDTRMVQIPCDLVVEFWET